MGRICEKIVNSIAKVLFSTNGTAKDGKGKKDVYTLSSVFPTPKIMKDVKKIL